MLEEVTAYMHSITLDDIIVSQVSMTPSLMWDWNQNFVRVRRDLHQQLHVTQNSLNEAEVELGTAIVQMDRFNNPHAYSETEMDSE